MRRWLALALLLLHLSAAAVASAQARTEGGATGGIGHPPSRDRTLRVLVLRSFEPSWATRARGQLSDLPASVIESSAVLEAAPETQVSRARELGRTQSADVVSWLSPDLAPPSVWGSEHAPGSFVVVWLAEPEQIYARRLGARWQDLNEDDRSAALEIGALTLRSAVRSLLMRPASNPEPVTAEKAETTNAWPFQAGAGLGWQIDGQTALGMGHVSLVAGVGHGRWAWTMTAWLGLPAHVAVPGAQLELERHALFFETAYDFVQSPPHSLAALLRAGAVLNRRETTASSNDVVALLPEHLFSPAVAAAVSGRWNVAKSHSLGVSIGAMWQLQSPRYVVLDAANDRALEYTLWNIQPFLELGWLWGR